MGNKNSAALKKRDKSNEEEEDEKHQRPKKIHRLYDDWKFSRLQSIVMANCNDEHETALMMSNLCDFIDAFSGVKEAKHKEAKQQQQEQQLDEKEKESNYTISHSEICKILLSENKTTECALWAAFYHDVCNHIDKQQKVPELDLNAQNKGDTNIILELFNSVISENEDKYLDSSTHWKEWLKRLVPAQLELFIREHKYRAVNEKDYDGDNVFVIPDSCGDNDELCVGILGDWGSGTEVATAVLKQLLKHKPDIIIHLGDVYYSGTKSEFKTNYIDPLNEQRKAMGHDCPIFSIPGNHDWYGGGKSFYDAVERLNVDHVPSWFKEKKYQQNKSFFVLKNKNWQLQGMDTGYDDRNYFGMEVGYYPRLEESELKYHQHHFGKADGRKILLFSHHPLFSAFEDVGGIWPHKKVHKNDKLQEQLKDNLKDITAWFWGHEHNFAIYGEYLGLSKGRLLGHSAVPYPVEHENDKNLKVEHKEVPLIKDNKNKDKDIISVNKSKSGNVWNHGYAVLKLQAKAEDDKELKAIATYYEIDGGGDLNIDDLTQTYQEDLNEKSN